MPNFKLHLDKRVFTLNPDKYYSCDRKVRYESEADAVAGVKLMRKKGQHGLESYQCRYGDREHWHIGHPRTKDVGTTKED